jgi:hypothetical protein
MKPSPHATILRALYGLYLDNRDDPKTLQRVQDISWALGSELDFEYGYFELAELIMSYRHDPNSQLDYYIDRVEGQLKTFDEYEKGIISERRKKYELEKASFPEVGVMLTMGVFDDPDGSTVRESAAVLLFIDHNGISMRGGTDETRNFLRDQVNSLGRLDLEDARNAFEKIAKQLAGKGGRYRLIDWKIVTREEAFPPFMY